MKHSTMALRHDIRLLALVRHAEYQEVKFPVRVVASELVVELCRWREVSS
jgi:hypothetical protein